MSNYDLNKHKKGDKVKWVLTLVAGILLAGACVSTLTMGIKNNGWFKPTENTPVEDTGGNVTNPDDNTGEDNGGEVTDPDDNTGGGNGGEVTVNSIFGNNPIYSDGTRMFTESVDENGNVSVTPAKSVYSERDATFNVEASTLYYAEATFTYNVSYNVSSEFPVMGLAHFNALNENIADGDTYNNAGALIGRRCIESIVTNNGKFLIKDLKPTDDHWYENYKTDNIYLDESFLSIDPFVTMPIAIARTAEKMYTFVDGVLVCEYDVPEDYSVATTPGIISCGARNDFTASNITVLTGSEASDKIAELITQTTFE